MRRHVLCDVGTIGHTFDDFLHLPGADEPLIMHREVMLQEGLYPCGHGHNSGLGLFPVRSALAVDSDGLLLPENVLGGQTTEFRHAKSGIEQGPNNEFFHIPPDLVVDRWAADGESGSHHDFRFRHDVWTMLFHQSGEEITSIISIAWYFTTKSGGI